MTCVRRELLVAAVLVSSPGLADDTLLAWWTFDNIVEARAVDRISDRADPISGNYRTVEGVNGSALILDGYTTVLTRAAADAPLLSDAFTIETWIAVAAYPWNRVPIVDLGSNDGQGVSFELGARGQLSLRTTVDSRVIELETDEYVVPLRQWVHVAARFSRTGGLALFLDGKPVAERPLPQPSPRYGRVPTRRIDADESADMLVGAVRAARRPAAFHRFRGTRPAWYSLDGILDELRIHGVALDEREISSIAGAVDPGPPPLAQRLMPAGPPGPGRFGAYQTTLSFYPEWDALWRVGPDADLVVRFDTSPARVVFWRGTQYSPAWVTENGLWMADQSIEGYDEDYTWEHMNDKQNRYSHVRLIEETDARVVVHWRYAPVNVDDDLMNPAQRLGNGAWVDEYYTFYPDAAGVRKVSWQRDTLGAPIQFQESIPLAQPGQRQGDVIEAVYATVGNIDGESQVLEYVEDPGEAEKRFPDNLTIQMHNLRSPQKPFIIFEPGNRMSYLRDLDIRSLSRPGSSSHWPVAQIPSDGRTAQALDRATSFLGFPISEPPVRQGPDGRDYWTGLYGMTDRPFEEVVALARSWVAAAPATDMSGAASISYDRSERAYRMRLEENADSIGFTLAASAGSPLHNVAMIVKDWGDADVIAHVDERKLVRGKDFRFGHRHSLQGTDLIVWLAMRATDSTGIRLSRAIE